MNYADRNSGQPQRGETAGSRVKPPTLQSVLSIDVLSRRPSRAPDFAAECRALIALSEQLAVSSDGILQKLTETALALCRAHSAGISLLEPDGKRFYWPAIAGRWAEHVGGGTPREYGPCGTVLDNNTALLFSHPERDFDYFAPVTPPVEEALLTPFYIGGKAVGTVWIIAHDLSRRFDSEDLRLMTDLGTFAASAYQVLTASSQVSAAAAVIESSHDAVVTKDLNGIITSWNAGAEHVFGYSPEEAIGQPITMVIPADRQHEETRILERIRRGERTEHYETIRLRKDGTLVNMSLTVSPIKDASGRIIGASKIARDVSERKQAELGLRNSEEMNRSLMDGSADCVKVLDLDGHLLLMNAPGLCLLEIDDFGPLCGQQWTKLWPAEASEEIDRALSMARSGTPSSFDAFCPTVKGTPKWWNVTVSPVRDVVDGKIVRLLAVSRDITERKKAEGHVSVLAREAEHRTKNILSNVQAIVQLTQAENVADFKKTIEGRIRAVANANNLFVETRWAGAELHALVTLELAPYRRSDGKRVHVEGPETLLEPNIAQTVAVVIHELATNAAKYGALSAGSGRVDVTWTAKEAGRLVLIWAETGGPAVAVPSRQGFGTRVLRTMTQQASGEMRFDWRPAGLVCEIELPI